MKATNQYDFIIAGAGCAGLSLLMHMIDSKKFADKKVLLVDKEEKNNNDRTWCFWETKPGLFDPIVFKQWDKLLYHDSNYSRLMDIKPYSYKMIRGIDFYDHCFNVIRKQKNIEVLVGNIEYINSDENGARLTLDGENLTANYIFNSIIFKKPELKKNEYYLLQHFKGWIIETEQASFDLAEATMMDFRVDQKGGVTFIYVMPFSESKALIECTVFSEKVLDAESYDQALKDYINRVLKIDRYKIIEEEMGQIPMTNHHFSAGDNRIVNIGTAGGQTKGSSGYTFNFIQKHSAEIIKQLVEKGEPVLKQSARRFGFYDSIFLNILYHKKLSGPQIFTPMIKKNKPQHVLRFLDNESSLVEDLKIISSLPTLPFFQAAIKQF